MSLMLFSSQQKCEIEHVFKTKNKKYTTSRGQPTFSNIYAAGRSGISLQYYFRKINWKWQSGASGQVWTFPFRLIFTDAWNTRTAFHIIVKRQQFLKLKCFTRVYLFIYLFCQNLWYICSFSHDIFKTTDADVFEIFFLYRKSKKYLVL